MVTKKANITEHSEEDELQSIYLLLKTGEVLVYFGPSLTDQEARNVKGVVFGPTVKGKLTEELEELEDLPFLDGEEGTLH